MLRTILFFLFIGLPTISFAQKTQIKGIISVNGYRISNANIININSLLRKTSDLRGEFEIGIKSGDTLITVLQGYKPDTTLFTNQNFLAISLIPSAIALKEVNINGNKISAAEKHSNLKKEYHDIYRKGDIKNMVSISPLGFGINVDKLYNFLSREGKNARKMQQILNADYKNEVIDARFTKNLVVSLTKLQGKELDEFMFNHRPTFELINNYSDFELSSYIIKKFKKK